MNKRTVRNNVRNVPKKCTKVFVVRNPYENVTQCIHFYAKAKNNYVRVIFIFYAHFLLFMHVEIYATVSNWHVLGLKLR